jgi:7-carboxy-7-deazaguanine synthase
VKALVVNETFVSVQGEGGLVGTPSTFVRLTGCSLRCSWCDTPATSWRPVGARRTVEDLLEECMGGPRHVVVTGGEPLLQAPVVELVARLQSAGQHVTIETAGVADLPVAPDLLSLSPKLTNSTPTRLRGLPAYARHERLRQDIEVARSLVARARAWQLKFVIDPARVGDDAMEVDAWLARAGLADTAGRVFLMPQCADRRELVSAYATLMPQCITRGWRLGQRLHVEMGAR